MRSLITALLASALVFAGSVRLTNDMIAVVVFAIATFNVVWLVLGKLTDIQHELKLLNSKTDSTNSKLDAPRTTDRR